MVGQPTITTSPPTTPAAPIDLSSFVFPAENVPPFSGVVAYDAIQVGGDSAETSIERTIARVLFENPENYLYEVLSTAPASGVEGSSVAAGLTILGVDGGAWIKEPDSTGTAVADGFEPARHLLWNSTYPAWDEICATGAFEALSAETIAGRVATHARCSTLAEDYELWVDTSTGIVMKLRGVLGADDFLPATSRQGGFQIIEFALGDVELPAAPERSTTTSSESPATRPGNDEYLSMTRLTKGSAAPVFSGMLLDGSAFHLEDLRGHPAVVFSWGSGIAQLQQYMDDFQALSESGPIRRVSSAFPSKRSKMCCAWWTALGTHTTTSCATGQRGTTMSLCVSPTTSWSFGGSAGLPG